MNDFAPGAAPPRGPQFDNRRVLAGVIDVLIVAVIGGVIGTVAGSWSPALSAVVLGWGLFYYFALESGAGQTVGKRLLGLRVTMADGSPADTRAIAIRTVLRVIDGIGLYVVGLIVMLVSGERRQRLGDMAGGTIITSADYAPAAAPPASAAAPTSSVVLPEAPAASFVPPIVSDPEPAAEPAPAAVEPAPVEEPVVVVEPAPVEEPVVVVEPAPVEEPVVIVEPAPLDEPVSALEPAPAVDFAPDVDASPAPAPSAEAPSAFFEAPVADASQIPELKPFQPFSESEQDAPAAAEEDEQVKVRSVETISNIDLLMGDVEEDEAAGRTP